MSHKVVLIFCVLPLIGAGFEATWVPMLPAMLATARRTLGTNGNEAGVEEMISGIVCSVFFLASGGCITGGIPLHHLCGVQ